MSLIQYVYSEIPLQTGKVFCFLFLLLDFWIIKANFSHVQGATDWTSFTNCTQWRDSNVTSQLIWLWTCDGGGDPLLLLQVMELNSWSSALTSALFYWKHPPFTFSHRMWKLGCRSSPFLIPGPALLWLPPQHKTDLLPSPCWGHVFLSDLPAGKSWLDAFTPTHWTLSHNGLRIFF